MYIHIVPNFNIMSYFVRKRKFWTVLAVNMSNSSVHILHQVFYRLLKQLYRVLCPPISVRPNRSTWFFRYNCYGFFILRTWFVWLFFYIIYNAIYINIFVYIKVRLMCQMWVTVFRLMNTCILHLESRYSFPWEICK